MPPVLRRSQHNYQLMVMMFTCTLEGVHSVTCYISTTNRSIKSCPDAERDILSQEITLLQAIKMKDKSKLPQYLKYQDKGYMYFPDISFVLFLRNLDEIVKGIINTVQYKMMTRL